MQVGTRIKVVGILLTLALVASGSFVATAATTSISVKTDKQAYSASDTIIITGNVTPAPAPNTTSAFITVTNPNGKVVSPSPANVGNNGAFQYNLGAGGTSNWVSGVYTVNASWSSSISTKPVWNTTTFMYSPAAITTSTSSTSTTTTTSTASTTSTTSTTKTTSTTSASSTTTSLTTTSSTSTSSGSTARTTSSTSASTSRSTTILPTSSTTTSAGGPGTGLLSTVNLIGIAVVGVGVVAAFMLIRRRGKLPGS